jgi:hypothetical protein
MKKTIKTTTAVLFFLGIISCTKQNATKPVSDTSSAGVSTSDKAVAAFSIGQHFGGGIIFYIDNTKQHGLIAATSDQGTGIAWYNGQNKVTNATGTKVGTGNANTRKIVNVQGKNGTYAALLCFNYKNGGFSDWYLPSKDELNLLYQQRNVVGGLGATNYWSSSEVSKGTAWDQEFGGGFQFKDNKSFTLNVRAIRSF